MLEVAINSVFATLMESAYKATVTDLLSEEEFAKASGIFFALMGIRENMFLIAGVILAVTGVMVYKMKSVVILEEEAYSNETIIKTCSEGLYEK